MKAKINLDATYVQSEDLVSREIEGELIIVPLVAGMGDMEDELFTLNETGRAVWAKLDGKKSLKTVAKELSAEFEAPPGEIERDVTGLAEELLKRKMIVKASKK
ncbi:MAG: PqqD family protein [Deltaproteobacteria bacterium]|nr:PqqD family protein [Deltaproteobacteria bacterium]